MFSHAHAVVSVSIAHAFSGIRASVAPRVLHFSAFIVSITSINVIHDLHKACAAIRMMSVRGPAKTETTIIQDEISKCLRLWTPVSVGR